MEVIQHDDVLRTYRLRAGLAAFLCPFQIQLVPLLHIIHQRFGGIHREESIIAHEVMTIDAGTEGDSGLHKVIAFYEHRIACGTVIENHGHPLAAGSNGADFCARVVHGIMIKLPVLVYYGWIKLRVHATGL